MKKFTAAFLVAAILPSMMLADDWPQWRGANRDGRSAETGLLKQWPEGGPKLLWSVKGIGVGYASVSVKDGMVYTTGMVGKTGTLFAFDTDGKKKFAKTYGPEWTKNFPGSRSTPTIDDALAYVVSGYGNVVCFDAKSGARKWSVDALKKFRGRNISWGISESPLIVGDKLIVTPGGKDASVVALDKKTGKTIWTSKGLSATSAYCSPLEVQLSGGRMIVQMLSGLVVGLDAATGKTLWTYRYKQRVCANTPIWVDGSVFVTSGYGKGAELIRVSGKAAERVWSEKTMDCHHGGAVLVDGYIYATSHRNGRGKWVCLDARTGKVMWTDSGVGKGSVIYADGMLYCYGENGEMGLVKPSPKGFQLVSGFRISQGSGKHWAHPAVANGRLYIRHGDVLMCYDIKAPETK